MCRGDIPSHQHMAACEVYNYAKIIHRPDINEKECTHTPFFVCNALLPRARKSSWDLSGGAGVLGYS